jgi:RNA polymerase primary sigma factor
MTPDKQTKGGELSAYFQDVRKTHPLTREEEQKLSERIKKGNLRARNQLVTANLRFALDVAKRYQGRGVALEDLISAANFGLLEAAKRFDGDNGVRFITYAVWWIRRYILKN